MPEHRYDRNSGALIFKLTPDEKKAIEYQRKIDILEQRIDSLENELNDLKSILMEVTNRGKHVYS